MHKVVFGGNDKATLKQAWIHKYRWRKGPGADGGAEPARESKQGLSSPNLSYSYTLKKWILAMYWWVREYPVTDMMDGQLSMFIVGCLHGM